VFLSVYAPHAAQPPFFLSLQNLISSLQSQHFTVFVAGDFNSYVCPLDSRAVPPAPSGPLAALLDSCSLRDAFRILHPRARAFSWSSVVGWSNVYEGHSRIDAILVPASVASAVTAARMRRAPAVCRLTDHALCEVRVQRFAFAGRARFPHRIADTRRLHTHPTYDVKRLSDEDIRNYRAADSLLHSAELEMWTQRTRAAVAVVALAEAAGDAPRREHARAAARSVMDGAAESLAATRMRAAERALAHLRVRGRPPFRNAPIRILSALRNLCIDLRNKLTHALRRYMRNPFNPVISDAIVWRVITIARSVVRLLRSYDRLCAPDAPSSLHQLPCLPYLRVARDHMIQPRGRINLPFVLLLKARAQDSMRYLTGRLQTQKRRLLRRNRDAEQRIIDDLGNDYSRLTQRTVQRRDRQRRAECPRLTHVEVDGVMTSEPAEVRSVIHQWATAKFSARDDAAPRNPGPIAALQQLPRELTDAVRREMTAAFVEKDGAACAVTTAEIKQVVASMKADSAPGHDGVRIEFYQRTYLAAEPSGRTVQHHMSCDAAYDLLATLADSVRVMQYVPESWRRGEVHLVPKPRKPPSELSSQRPITISPIASRIACKAYTRRALSACLRANLFSGGQAACQPAKSTRTNILKLLSVLHDAVESSQPLFALFLDIAGAYDHVQYGKFREVLLGLGFPVCVADLFVALCRDRVCRVLSPYGPTDDVPVECCAL